MSSQQGRGNGRRGRRSGSGFRGGNPRARRGDVRNAILHLLNEEPMHGYQIMQELSERTQGAWRPSAGSIYPTLQQLEDESLVEASEIEGKKVFALTVAGREAVSAGRPPWEQFESHGVHHDLRLAARGVAGAVMEVARTGTDDQAARVKEILEKARRDIYLLLAGDVTE